MKITISKNDKMWKEFELPTERLTRAATKLGVFTFASKEIMRARPPRRHAGVILNLMTAVAVTDAVMAFADGMKKGMFGKEKEPEVVKEETAADCETYSEAMGDQKEEPKNE